MKKVVIIESIFPIAIYLLLGYLFKVIYQDNSKQLIEFVINISLPAIVFSKVYPLVLEEKILHLILMFICFILFNLIFSYIVGKILKLNRILLSTFMIIATFGNTSFIGFSYIDAFYGDEFIVYGLIYDLFGSFLLLVSIGMLIINWGKNKKNSIVEIFKTIFLFPPNIMLIITIIAKNFEIPNFFILTSQTLGSTLVPIAMIAIGMKLELKNIFVKFNIVSMAILIKMIIVPIIILMGFQAFYGINETWVKVTIIELAMPPMTMAVVMIIKNKLDERVAINSLVLGVLLSFFIITLYVSFLR